MADMSQPHRPSRRRWGRAGLPWLVLALGLALSFAAQRAVEQLSQREARDRLMLRAERAKGALDGQLRVAVTLLQVARRQLGREPSSQALAPWRPSDAYVYDTLPVGLASISWVRWSGPDPARPAACRTEWREELDSEQAAGEFDPCEEAAGRELIWRAGERGELSASGPQFVLARQPLLHGALLALPVYRAGLPLFTRAQRGQAFQGAVVVSIPYAALIAAGGGATVLAGLGDAAGGGADAVALPYELGGGRWLVYPTANEIDDAGPSPGMTFGLGLAGVAAALALLQWRRRHGPRASPEQRRLTQVLAALPEVIWSLDLPGHRLGYLSPAAEALLGPAWRHAAGATWWRRLVPRGQRRALIEWCLMLGKGGKDTLDIELERTDGSRRRMRLRACFSYAADGRPLRIDGVASDVTERWDAETQLRKLSMVVEQNPASVVITDVNGVIEYVNPRYCQITGYEPGEVIGLTPRVNASGQTPPAVYAELWRAIRSGTIWHGELLNRRRNGELYWELEVIAPVFDHDGALCNFVAIKEDITERKRAEAEMRRMNRTLRVLTRCNAALVRADNEAALLESMCDVLAHSGGYRLAMVGWPRADHTIEVAAQRGFDTPDLAAILATVRWGGDGAEAGGPSARALRSGTIVIERELDGPAGAPWVVLRRDAGVQAIASLPLRAGAEVLGVLSLCSMDAAAFDSAEVALLAELADDLAYGIASLRSASVRLEQERELVLMRRAIDASSEAIMLTDQSRAEQPLVYVNAAFERITGFAAADALGRNLRLLYACDREQSALSELNTAIAARRAGRVEVRTYRKDGSPFWSELAVAPVLAPDGAVSHVVAVLSDVTERKRWEAQLAHQATHDPLTGLPNRLLLTDRLARAIATARRDGRCVALLMMDLDRFKLINDSLGHGVGDALLKQCAERLLARAGGEDTMARLGADTFVAVCPLTDEGEAGAVAQALWQALSGPQRVEDQELYLACSAGLALFPRDGDDDATLMRCADTAMYRARANGGGQIRYYSEEDGEGSPSRRLQLEMALRGAVGEGQLHLHFQPKVHLASGRLAGAEVLLRWQHPELGAVSPAEFIPLAEETGMILPIGAWVLREACRQGARWRERGLPPLALSVNLSARQFAQTDLVEQVRQILTQTGYEPGLLQLELTESALVRRPEEAAHMLRKLRALGVSLSLDDFGTGFSSLSYLCRFPIDQMKIDQSFVRQLVSDADSAAIAVSVINLGHSLGMEVVAEGVESSAQLHFLRRHDCDQIQGYLSGRPMPAAQFEAVLASGAPLFASEGGAVLRRTLLLLDESAGDLAALQGVFADEGYRLLSCASSEAALGLLAGHDVDVVVVDAVSAVADGGALLRHLKQVYPHTVRLVLSGATDEHTLSAVINAGAVFKLLGKPWDEHLLRETVRDAFRYHEQTQGKRLWPPPAAAG